MLLEPLVSIEVQCVKPPFRTPTSCECWFEHWLFHLESSFLLNVPGSAAEGGLRYLGPCHHVGGLFGVPGSWLHQMEDFSNILPFR